MEQYLNLSGKSGIEAYEIGETYVSVRFKNKSKCIISLVKIMLIQ
jgi:hypothetical protein